MYCLVYEKYLHRSCLRSPVQKLHNEDTIWERTFLSFVNHYLRGVSHYMSFTPVAISLEGVAERHQMSEGKVRA